ncbi:MAG: oligoendopeptidase F [Prolixibacteraceae bacterium]|nr:oligoendopeptidase F [Prolixibacteraceae bacterium]MBN2648980.1 oligoendopeptidase F [Prolixibacteraceae bacterium]
MTVFVMFAAMNTYSQKERAAIADKYKWDLTDIYKTEDAWQADKERIAAEMQKITRFKGIITQSAQNLLECLEFNSKVSKEATKLYIYASMKSDLDTRVMKYNGMQQQLQQMFSDFGANAAFIEPEILSVEWETIEGFIKEEPKLEVYRMGLENMFRTKKHTLSEAEERIMALSGMVSGVPQSVFGTFSNAEMPEPEVTLSDGEKVKLNSATYSKYRASGNRADREIVFENYWNNFAKFKGTYGEMLYGNVKKDVFYARARHYESALESALYPNNIQVEVYHSLVDNVNKNLPAFHRYLDIKKRMLGVDTLKYLDLYAPVVEDLDLKYTYDEAVKITLEALKPLGDDYMSVVKKATEERWIDVYPTPGKRSGAYSNGAFYDGHPFILLNYTELYNDVSTLVHELGHTMHSYYSNKNQPYPLSDYQIFVAEVASTLNEVLLFNYMLEKVEDDDVRLVLLMNWLDSFKGTLFRQTQFAEYELKIHEEVEKGKPLTGDEFSALYTNIVNRYYGHDKGVCHVDDYIGMEWAFIPHFYYNFYVYQYSTSFTASISLAEKVMEGDKKALKSYLAFLSSGGSDYPIELLKKAGVDMTTSAPFDKAIESMNKVMDEIEKILDKKQK